MRKSGFLFMVVAALSAPSFGQVWVESPDAPELLPGQTTVGVGPLTAIRGVNDASDADLYCIRIVDEANFYASMVAADGGFANFDTQLFLFDANGMGVVHNDDFSGLLSKLDSTQVTANGTYYLAISRYNRDPRSAGGLIWNNSPFTGQRVPDGPGAGQPLASWTGTTSAGGDYTIALRGVEFCEIPEPASLVLLSLAGLFLRRR